jgi:Tfp pilus assembly protein PilX
MRSLHRSSGRRGTALFTALVSTVLAAGLTAAAVSLTGTDRRDVERGEQRLSARALATAGIHEGLSFVRDTMSFDPFDPVGALEGDPLIAMGAP